MEDFDIYADLPSFNADENKNENVENNSKEFVEINESLEKEVSLLRTKLEELEGLNNKLKNNFSSLIKTAKAEISRKDRTINDLRAQLDNIAFRRNQYHRNTMQLRNSNYLNYPPPINTTEYNNELKQYQEMNNYVKSETRLVIEEFKEEENIESETQQNVSNNECDDGITNTSNYKQYTIYGDRLHKRLLEEMENEKRKKEEESKQKNDCFDKVSNKENLALINESVKKVESHVTSDKNLDNTSNSSDFVKSETKLTKQINYIESKEEQFINRKNDIPKSNKYFTTNGGVTDAISRNYSNNYNNSLIHKNYRNRDLYNHQDRHRLNEVFYIESNNCHNRRDKYNNQFEKYNRHRSSYRYKSLNIEKRSNSLSSKDDLWKKHYKQLEDKYDRIPKKIKLHQKDKEDRQKVQSLKESKRVKEYKIKTSKRKRRSESEEKISRGTKRRKKIIETSNETIRFNKIPVEETTNGSFESKKRKKLKSDVEKSGNNVEYIKETTKLHKTIEEITIKGKKSVQVKGRKKMTIQECNEKLTNNVECLNNSTKSNRNSVKETEIYNYEQKESIQKQEINQNNSHENVINNESNEKQVNQKYKSDVEYLMEELEDGEIVDSPKYCIYDQKVEDTVKNKMNIEVIVSKDFKTQENDKIKESLNSNKKENYDLSKTDNENCKSLEITADREEHYCIRSIKPKKDENKNIENGLLLRLLTQGVSEKHNNSSFVHKEIQENTGKRLNLDIKSVEYESNIEKNKNVSVTNAKLIKHCDDKKTNKIPVLHIKLVKQEDNNNDDDEQQMMDSNENSKENNNKTSLNDKIIDNITNVKEHKDIKKLQIKEDEVKDICIEKNERNTDTDLQMNKKQENNINNNLDKQIYKLLNDTEILPTNKDTENSLNKKTPIISKPQTIKNVIVIRRRRRPVQLSDSPPVLIITQTGLCKST